MNKNSYERINDLLMELEEKGPLVRLTSEEAEYLKELLNEGMPKLNELYAINVSDIKGISCVYNSNDYEDNFQHRFVPVNNNDNNDYVTYIKYIGNGKFIELFTNKTINLIINNHIYNTKQNNDNFNYVNYNEEYKNYYRNPLYIDFNDCHELDLINNNAFLRHVKDKEKIIKYITRLETNSSIYLMKTMNELIDSDHGYAIIEDNIRMLKK